MRRVNNQQEGIPSLPKNVVTTEKSIYGCEPSFARADLNDMRAPP